LPYKKDQNIRNVIKIKAPHIYAHIVTIIYSFDAIRLMQNSLWFLCIEFKNAYQIKINLLIEIKNIDFHAFSGQETNLFISAGYNKLIENILNCCF